MKAFVFIATATLASLTACSDDNSMMLPTGPGTSGTSGGVAGADTGATAGSTAGSTGASGSISTPPTTTAGSGGRAGAGTGAAGAGTGGTGGTPAAGSGGGAAGDDGAAGEGEAGSGGTDTPNEGGTDPLPPIPADKALPLIFVHGYVGSAAQYMSQAQRFVANGYPPERIRAYEHNGDGNATTYVSGLGKMVDEVLAEFNTDKIYLVGHSRGTAVSGSYLNANASKVAKYVAVDGAPCPSSVPCVAPTQAKFPGQKHVEVCTSKESFEMQYEFLIGSKPQVVDIVKQRPPVEIAGRVVNFPANTGRAGTTLKVFELVTETGARAKPDPIGTFMIGEDGNWGPVTVNPDKYYEFELTGAGSNITSHFYWQRFLRSTNFVRLLSGPPDSPARMNTNVSDKHAAMVISRQREWLASDVLEISTKSPSGDQPAVNAMTAAAGAKGAIGFHVHDAAASPGNSTLSGLPYFSNQAFQYGVDVFMPAADPPDGVITIRNLPRGDMTKPQVLNIPNWPSSNHTISVTLSDFPME